VIAPALPRWVASVLGDAVVGVNALLNDVPRQPDEAAPPDVDVFNAVDEQWVARARFDDQASADRWILAIAVAEELDELAGAPSEGTVEDTAIVTVSLLGVAARGNNARMLADAYRVMRVVRRVLYHAFAQVGTDALELEGQLCTPPAQFGLSTHPADGGRLSLVLELPFAVTDTWAYTPLPEP
jgi:hypothetical protein